MKNLILIAICLLMSSVAAFAFPQQFANGRFAQGRMAVGAYGVSGGGGGGAPGDGYEANLFAYYACEDASGGAIDSTSNHRDLGQSIGPCNSTDYHGSGFIGNGFDVGGYCGLHTGLLFDSSTGIGANADYSFQGLTSFTVRFWCKTSADANRDNFIGTESTWEIYFGPAGGIATDGRIEFDLETDASSFTIDSTEMINDGAWHRVICWFDSGTLEVGIQIDNNTPVTTTADGGVWAIGSPQSLKFGQPTWDVVTPPAANFLVDELAIWSGYSLTSSDRTFDWNSGSGHGYPLP